MSVEISDNAGASRFEIVVDGVVAGFAEYHLHGGEIAFIHTEVDSKFGGQGLGGKLARGALDAVRERGLDVLPYCPFIRGWITKHPDYVDLVPQAHREKFAL